MQEVRAPSAVAPCVFSFTRFQRIRWIRPPSTLAAPPRERKEIREEKEHKRDKGPWKVKGKKKSCLVIFLSFLERVLTLLQAPHMLVFHCEMAELENLPN